MNFDSLRLIWPDVSRETFDDLAGYVAMLQKWNRAINLVGPDTIGDVWNRHILDSLQLWSHLPEKATRLLDIGSGAGFPGMVLAIVARENRSALKVKLVDSDHRKCEFLRSVARAIDVDVEVISDRIDQLPVQSSDVITARALAPLDTLLGFAQQHLAPGGVAVFLKGENADQELIAARANWAFTLETYPSETNRQAKVLKIGDLCRV